MKKFGKVRTWNAKEHEVERILLLLWMGLLVEYGLKDVYSFNKIHMSTS